MIYQVFGEIKLPSPLAQGYGELTGSGGGLVGFLNNLLKLVFLVAGIFSFINFILAGWGIMNSGGEPEKMSKATQKIWYSLIGLVVIIASYAFAALIGWLVFHDTNAILQINIYGPGT